MGSPLPGTNPGTVLVIEDSPVVQHFITASLRPLGVTVLLAADGVAGVELARTHLPDVVLLDIGLPLLDGWEVLTDLRSHSETSSLPVIIVTAYAQPGVADTAEQKGVDGFVTKPFSPLDLRLKVRALIDQGALSATG